MLFRSLGVTDRRLRAAGEMDSRFAEVTLKEFFDIFCGPNHGFEDLKDLVNSGEIALSSIPCVNKLGSLSDTDATEKNVYPLIVRTPFGI